MPVSDKLIPRYRGSSQFGIDERATAIAGVIHMDTVSKRVLVPALLLMGAGMAYTGMTASAQAQTWNPDSSHFLLVAQDPTFAGATCDTGTIEGWTGSDSAVFDVNVQFQPPCTGPGGLDTSVACTDDSATRLRALNAATDQAEVDEFLTGFQCVVTVPGVCAITVGAQELPIPGGANHADLIEGGSAFAAIDVIVDMIANRAGSSLCGPSSMTTSWEGLYEGADGMTIDP